MEIDISKGLKEFLDIDWGDRIVEQHLYYLHVPFKCHFFWAMSHLLDAWNLVFGSGRSCVTPDVGLVDNCSPMNSQETNMLIGADAQTPSTQNTSKFFPCLDFVYVELAMISFDTIDYLE